MVETAKKISCVIAAYNEEPRIGEVLKAVSGHPLLFEVIVVDDGSKDKTADVVRSFPGIKLVQQGKNQGKSKAVAAGIEAAQGDYICALDADLVGITADSVTKLITPVLEGIAPVTISLRQNCPGPWRLINFDMLSGERVYPKELLGTHLDDLRHLTKFGIETFMNRLIITQKIPLMIVFLPGVISPFKYSKTGWWSGLMADIKMFIDIFKTSSPPVFAWEMYRLNRLKVPQSQKFTPAP